MPILIQIIVQRIVLLILGGLAFIGINPDINLKSPEQIATQQAERQEIVENLLQETDVTTSSSTEFIRKISKEIVLPEITPKQKETVTNTKPAPISPPIQVKPAQQPTKVVEPDKVPVVTPTPPSVATSGKNEDAIVQIACINRIGNTIGLTNGSGVIINSNGVVLTNAHVAQFFLLNGTADYKYECTLTQENIPTYGYQAKLLYISPTWIKNNPTLYKSSDAKGTGEYDFAFLVITKNTNPVLSLPSSFPSIPINTSSSAAEVGDSVTAYGYPGKNSGSLEIDLKGSLVKQLVSIAQVYTYSDGETDIFTTTPSTVARQGSSGGGLVENGKLIGIVSTTANYGDGNVINAITLSYIDKQLRKENSTSISTLIAGTPEVKADSFAKNTAPSLKKTLLGN